MVYLIGIDHTLQHDRLGSPGKHRAIDEFLKYVELKAQQLEVTTIGEEWSEEANKNNKVECSTVQNLACKLGLEHILCDPTSKERLKNNIEKKDSNRREEFWLTRLKGVLHEKILFICGDQHLKSFKQKLEHRNISVEIISSGWRDSPFTSHTGSLDG